jgi:hypothetical protein
VFISPEMVRAPSFGRSYGTASGSSQTGEIEREANEVIGRLTQEERQTVTELSREGFQMGDVFQAFLLCSKDVAQTRTFLRSLK